MKRLTLLLAMLALPLTASAEEPAPTAESGGLHMSVEVAATPYPYGEAFTVHVNIENRTTKRIEIFHDHRLKTAMRIELVDQHGVIWRAVATPKIVLGADPFVPGRWASVIMPGTEFGMVVPIEPKGRLRLSFELSTFVPTNAPSAAQGWQRLSMLPPGTYTVRSAYSKRDINVPVGKPKVNPRLLQVLPPYILRPYPGLFTGQLQAEAELTIGDPNVDVVDRLRKRVHALEAENARLRAIVDRVRAAVGSK